MSSDDQAFVAHNPEGDGFIVVQLFGNETADLKIQTGQFARGFSTPAQAILYARELHCEYGYQLTDGVLEDISRVYSLLNSIITGES